MLIEFSFDATAVPHNKQNYYYLFAVSPENFFNSRTTSVLVFTFDCVCFTFVL